jgi:Flp pilus assembly protein TadD
MIKHLWRSLLILLTAATLATAADTPEPARAPADRDLGEARTRIAAKDWPGARDVMQKAVAREPGNAEYHNLLAYSMRHTANPNMDVVFKHYGEALRIDPKHKGAHEYIGEAYLLVGNVAKAKEHLAALDKLCFFSCEEFRDLKKAIQEYEARKK